jgi:hypothetical protein
VAFVEHHIAGLHGDVVRLALVVVDFDWPGLVQVLGHLDDTGAHEGKPINICKNARNNWYKICKCEKPTNTVIRLSLTSCKHCAVLVNADSIQ